VLSTVGFGDITPQLHEEKMFSILAELCGCVLFASLIGGLSGIFDASPLNQKISDQVEELREWSMNHVALPPNLHQRLVETMENLYRRDVFSEARLLHRLKMDPTQASKKIKEEIEIHLKERQTRGHECVMDDADLTLEQKVSAAVSSKLDEFEARTERKLEALELKMDNVIKQLERNVMSM